VADIFYETRYVWLLFSHHRHQRIFTDLDHYFWWRFLILSQEHYYLVPIPLTLGLAKERFCIDGGLGTDHFVEQVSVE
jgi:hypothetical protein